MEAAKELEYAVVTLGFPGVMVGANIQGQPLDESVFTDFWEMADRLGTIVFIHPAEIRCTTSLDDFGLRPLLGYLFDTSVAVARLALSGHLELYPHVRIIVPHLGGVLPFVLNRLDRGYEIHEETRRIAPYAPSHYLTNSNVYYDTVSLHRPALLATVETVGVQRLLFGSDSPHTTGGTVEEIYRALKELELPPEEELLVLEGNVNRLFKL
jgi:Predicted metal-dependent hydrolase of the TIM-barrel fold